jgi:hypothetical protein
MAFYNYQTVTIANGATDSDAIDLQGHTLVGIQIPAAMTGATVQILESQSTGGTFRPVGVNGAATALTATVNSTIAVNPITTSFCVNFLKIRSVSAEGAQRSIGIISRVID